MNNTPSKISIKNLSKKFGDKKILDNLSLDLQNHESLVVIGGSGTGKSVLLKSILGLIKPDSGSIKIDGIETLKSEDKSSKPFPMAKFGMLFQGGALFDSMKVWQNIAFLHLQQNKINKKQAQELAVEKLSQVGLPAHVAQLMPSELSGGMQKRVSLARAIASNPEILFFDEPTTGLDPIMSDIINNLIIKCTKTLGCSSITITHDMNSAKKISDRIAMLYQGKIIWQGNADSLENSDNEFVAQFVQGKADGPIEYIR